MKLDLRTVPVLMLLALLVLAAHADDGAWTVHANEAVDLTELADGETRVIGDGDRAITVTRNGDVVRIEESGEKVEEIRCPASDDCTVKISAGDGHANMIVIASRGIEGDGVVHAVPDGANVFFSTKDGKGVEMHRNFVFSGDDDSVKLMKLFVGADVSLYECPKGDTTMRLEKDDEGPYFCPKHGEELIKRAGSFGAHGFHVIELDELHENQEEN